MNLVGVLHDALCATLCATHAATGAPSICGCSQAVHADNVTNSACCINSAYCLQLQRVMQLGMVDSGGLVRQRFQLTIFGRAALSCAP